MKYTICIPTYNRPDLMKNVLISLVSQTFKNFNVLIINNSSDHQFNFKYQKYINDFSDQLEIKYIINEKNIGMFGNWNKCIEFANSDYITIISDDDFLNKNYLHKINESINDDICAVMVAKKNIDLDQTNDIETIINTDLKKQHTISEYDKRIFKYINPIGTPAGFIFKRRTDISFDKNYYPSSDYKFITELSKLGKIICINLPLAYVGIGYNDSRKISVIDGFIKNDHKIRRDLGCNNLISSILSFMQKHKYYIEWRHSRSLFSLLISIAYKIISKILIMIYTK